MTPVLEIRQLHKAFGGLAVTQGVDLTVLPGERHLIIGPNGAGKTTLFNQITGDLLPDSGSIRLLGQDITRLPTYRRVHLGLGRTYQILTLFPHDTLAHNVMLSLLGVTPRRWHPFAALGRMPDLYDQAVAVLNEVGLAQMAGQPLAETSYGEKRRLEIAMALAQKPRLLLLDEPFAGLSAEERQSIHDLLGRIPRDVAILMIEHDMDIALSLAERITLLHYGKVITAGSRSDVLDDPRTQEIYLGS